jgi:hypothetical protein
VNPTNYVEEEVYIKKHGLSIFFYLFIPSVLHLCFADSIAQLFFSGMPALYL